MSRLAGLAFAGWAFAGAILPAGRAAASEAQLNGVVFDLPDEGWVRQDDSGILLQKSFPRDETAGRRKSGAALLHLPPAATSGTFDANFATAAGMIPELATKRPMTKNEGVTVNGHAIRVERRCCASRNGVSLGATIVGIGSPAHQQFVVLVTMNLHGDDTKPLDADLARVARSVRLTPADRPFAVEPPEGSGGLDGVYTTLHTGLTPNAFGGMNFVAESRILALDPGGIYSRSIPSDGIADHCRQEPTDCGTYRLVGGLLGRANEIEMRDVDDAFGVIDVRTLPFSRKGGGLRIGSADYEPVAPLAPGTTFDGTWRYSFAASGTTAFSSGGVSVERTLTLRPDGTFSRTGSTGYMSSNETGDGRTSVAGSGGRPVEGGRYAASGYHLTLTGNDGRSERLSLFRPDKGSDELLVIGGQNHLKKKR